MKMYVLFLNMKCTCSSNIKIKPFDSCIFCAHKHAASALALTNFLIDDKSIILLKICSQIILSKWHLSKKYKKLISNSNEIVNKIINFKDFKNDLITYVEDLWTLINDNTYDDLIINNEDFFSKFEPSYINGIITLSNSIELLKSEINYKNINLSYAIGQLVISSWMFQDLDVETSLIIRNIYKKIEISYENTSKINDNIIEMNKLLSKLWIIYLNKYKQS